MSFVPIIQTSAGLPVFVDSEHAHGHGVSLQEIAEVLTDPSEIKDAPHTWPGVRCRKFTGYTRAGRRIAVYVNFTVHNAVIKTAFPVQ